MNRLFRDACSLQLLHRLLGLGEGSGREAFEVFDLRGELLDLSELFFLLCNQAGDRLFVLVDALNLVFHDGIVFCLDDMRIGVEHASCRVNLSSQ